MKRISAVTCFALLFCVAGLLQAEPVKPAAHNQQSANEKAQPTAVLQPTATSASAAAIESAAPATTGDVLNLTRQVLDLSKAHSEKSFDYLKNLFYFIGGVTALLGFLGIRKLEEVIKPYREKAEALQKEHEAAMKKQMDSFTEISQANARAQVIASSIWEYIEDSQKVAGKAQEEKLRDVITLVESALPSNMFDKLDSYLAGVLLIRKAYALKRLGDYQAAYESAVKALSLNEATAKHFWVYNAACYAALAGQTAECYVLLRRAIREDATARADAATEEDFESIRNSPEFRSLLQPV